MRRNERWILLLALGVAAISAAVAVLVVAAEPSDETTRDGADETSVLPENLAQYGDPCGGDPENVLLLCYVGEDGALTAYVSRRGRVRTLVDSGDDPGWYIGVDLSPDQRHVAITGAHGAEPTGYFVEILNAETLQPVNETWDTATCWEYRWPSWSADGERLSVTATRPDGREATIVFAADGTVVERDPVGGWPIC